MNYNQLENKYMRLKKKKIVSRTIILVLFFAVFNDVIRIPNTALSAYRLSIPLILCMAFAYIKDTWRYLFAGFILIIPLIIQNLVFCNILKIENTIDIKWQLRYMFHYASIILIFILIRILRRDLEMFKNILEKFIPLISVLCICAYLLCLSPYYYEKIGLANPNDYAVCLAVVFPWYVIKSIYEERRNIFFCITIFIVLWKGDSKAALAGIVIQLGIILLIVLIKKVRESNRVLMFFIPIVILVGLAICLSPLKVNGYSIREMFIGFITHILSGKVYEHSTVSLGYRTNAIIYTLDGIVKSYFLGIGIGNTGKMLRKMITENVSSKALSSIALSPHNAVLEFFCDCGIWAIILCIYIYGIAIKKLFHAKKLGKVDMYFVSFTISFPMWVMSASGIYTIYLLFIIIAWLYEWSRLSIGERNEISQ